MGAVAEYEKSMLVAKLAAAKQQARASNPDYKEGRPRFGDKAGENETIGPRT
jgi:hypothetical protein